MLLQICQTTGLIVDVCDLLGGLGIEVDQLLASRGTSSLLVVRGQSSQESIGSGSDAIGVVNRLGLVGGMVL